MKRTGNSTNSEHECNLHYLKSPILFAGGALAAFGAIRPRSLCFASATAGQDAKDAEVQVLVALGATP